MAPLHFFDTSAVRTLFPRSTTAYHHFAPGLTAWIVLLSILFAILPATACFITYRITKSMSETLPTPTSFQGDQKPSMTTVTNSNWARKDSNVLWSAYFSEDDLKSHFDRKASQMSHGLSVGTLESDICPLEIEGVLAQPRNFNNADMRDPDVLPPPPSFSDGGVRSRVTYVQETTPPKHPRMAVRNLASFEDISIKDFGSVQHDVAGKGPYFNQPFLTRRRSAVAF
jgi:hypothetical protein